MSTNYTNTNQEKTRILFLKRLMYRLRLKAMTPGSLVDFNLGEKFLFGRVDRFFVPIEMREPLKAPLFAGFKSFRQTSGTQSSAQALSFVVDAFEDMSREFQKCVNKGLISADDPFLSNLNVYKAHVDHKSLYIDYLDTYLETLKGLFDKDGIKVRDFKDFLVYLMPYLEKIIKTVPFTKPAYIKSRRCPILCSGLAIEIADLDPINDDEKITKFIESKNWGFYVNACNSYGFMIDEFVPWRIVCDIDAPGMLKRSAKYFSPTTNSVIKNNYIHAHNQYFENFGASLLRLYNMVKYPEFYIYEQCNGSTIKKSVNPLSYTTEEFEKEFDEIYFLRLYCKIRFLEEESQFSTNEQDKLINDCVHAVGYAGIRKSLIIFERILNKTFDYRGSASYINKQMQAIKDDLPND